MFGNKTLTFMVKDTSIMQKFKQPVAFMFTNSITPNLVVAIKEVV